MKTNQRKDTIKTALGKRYVVRALWFRNYVFTSPRPHAPNGEWWTLNPQQGWVAVHPNSRALLASIAEDDERLKRDALKRAKGNL